MLALLALGAEASRVSRPPLPSPPQPQPLPTPPLYNSLGIPLGARHLQLYLLFGSRLVQTGEPYPTCKRQSTSLSPPLSSPPSCLIQFQLPSPPNTRAPFPSPPLPCQPLL